MKNFLTAALLVFTVSLAKAADIGSQIRFPVEKYTLGNGLVVLLHEDHSAPIVSYHTWFRVGSKDEHPGTTGIAHLFEHMMFTGTNRYSREQFDAVLQMNGATNNAFTTNDYTGYYENLPSSKLALVMDIESDRMVNLQVTEQNLKSEREVVKEERRFRVDNSPIGILHETLYGLAYKVHPYKWPVIGYMDDINNINLSKAQDFYRTYYAPNNAVLVIAGDFKISTVKEMVNKFYGNLKAQAIPKPALAREPLQQGPRIETVHRDVQNKTVALAYHVPEAGSEDSYALDLLANILGKGSSSRLFKRLIYNAQVATQVNVANYSMQDPGLFQVYVSLKPGLPFDSVQKAVYGEIWKTRNALVSSDELEIAKKQIMKGNIDSLKTVYGKAESLAQNEILFGNYERLFSDLERYEKVTVADVKRVSAKYLAPERSSFAILAGKIIKPEAQKGGQ